MFKTLKEYEERIGQYIELNQNEKDEIQSLFLNRIIGTSASWYHISLQEMMKLFSVIPVTFNFKIVKEHEEFIKVKDFDHVDLNSAYVTISKSLNIPIIRININVTPEDCINANNSSLLLVETIFNNHREEMIFIYFHELGHILEKDLNPLYHDLYKNAINRYFAGKTIQNIKFEDVGDKFVSQISNACQDYYINYQIMSRTNEFLKFSQIYLYNKDFKDLNKLEILDHLLKDIESGKIKIVVCNGNSGGCGKFKVSNGEKLVPMDTGQQDENNPDSGDDMEIDSNSTTAEDASDMINETLNQTMTKLRAMGSGGAFLDKFIGTPIEVDVSWTKQLITRVNNLAYMKLPRKDYGWKSPSKLMRHVATLPGMTNYDLLVSMPNIYIMFDQSGSVTNNEIRQMNFVIRHLLKKRYNLTILFHTAKIEHIEKVNIKNVGNIDEFVSHRYCDGGTSHKECFDYIKEEMKNVKMMKKSIVLIFSDFYSDIESYYSEYEWTRHVDTINLLSVGAKDNYVPAFGSSIRVK